MHCRQYELASWRTLAKLTTLLSTALLVAACSGSPVKSPVTSLSTPAATSITTSPPPAATISTSAAPTDSFDLAAIAEHFVDDASGGVAVLVVHNGELTTAAYGDADSGASPIARESPFRVGSISKTFVATMILQLRDEGKVELDEKLGSYLPDVPAGGDVTIRQLLSHQSGIANYTSNPAFFIDVAGDYEHTYEPEDILAFIDGYPPGPTGTFQYSNTDYILLGMLLEHLDATTLNESLQNRIAGPLGLASTRFVGHGVEAPAGLVSFWSFGLNTGFSGADYESIASGAWAAGALVSTVDDLSTFLMSLFEGDLISADALMEMTDTGTSGYGLGLFAAQLGDGNPGYAHNGSIPGFSSVMAISPEAGDIVVVLANNDILIAEQMPPQIFAAW